MNPRRQTRSGRRAIPGGGHTRRGWSAALPLPPLRGALVLLPLLSVPSAQPMPAEGPARAVEWNGQHQEAREAAVQTTVGDAARDPARADTLVRVWASTATATSGGRATVAIHVDMTGSGEALGRIRGRVRFTPTLLNLQEATPGTEEADVSLDTSRTETGVLGFEAGAEEPVGLRERTTLAEMTFWVMAPPGGLAPVVVELEVLESATGADLLWRAQVHEGTVLVR